MTVPEMPPAAMPGETSARSPGVRPKQSLRWLLFGPAVLFLGVALALVFGLDRDASILPSPLIGKPVPQFSLPPVKGRALGLRTDDLRGEVSLVNVFASWCIACREEHPVLMRLRQQGAVPIHGLNYKDKPDAAARWLDEMGDPYTRTGADLNGKVAIDWGVYGVPETFIVDAQGRIAFKQVGPVTPDILDRKIMPLVVSLRTGAAHGEDAVSGERR